MEAHTQATARPAAPLLDPQPMTASAAAPLPSLVAPATHFLPAPQFTFQPSQRNPPLYFDSRTATYQPDAAQGTAPGFHGLAANAGPPGAFRFSVSEPPPTVSAQVAAATASEPRLDVEGLSRFQPQSAPLSSDTRLVVLPESRSQDPTKPQRTSEAAEPGGDGTGAATETNVLPAVATRQASTVVITEVSAPPDASPNQQRSTSALPLRSALPMEGRNSGGAASALQQQPAAAAPAESAEDAAVPEAASVAEHVPGSAAALQGAGAAKEPKASRAGPSVKAAKPATLGKAASAAASVPLQGSQTTDKGGKAPTEAKQQQNVGGAGGRVGHGQPEHGKKTTAISDRSGTDSSTAQQQKSAAGSGDVSIKSQTSEKVVQPKPAAPYADASKLTHADFSHLPPHLRPRESAAVLKQVAGTASSGQPRAANDVPSAPSGTVAATAEAATGARLF